MNPVSVNEANGPLILAFPHSGTAVPDDILAKLNSEGEQLRDTDWHLDQVYGDLLPEATTVRAQFHRYVIDPNRDPAGVSLYPGQTTTGLVPTTTFDNQPIWRAGCEPDDADIQRRLQQFHAPYHAALQSQIERVKALHGFAIVYDCHSIRSEVPWLFEGQLPDFNIGTNAGVTCAAAIEHACYQAAIDSGRSHVLNGRFKGGWTTRHYGQPNAHVHAIQMELAQQTYLVNEQPPFAIQVDKLQPLRAHLKTILTAIINSAD